MSRIQAFPGNAASNFGRREIEDKLPSKFQGRQNSQIQRIEFSYDSLPTFGTDKAILEIPANAFLVRAQLRTLTPFAGGTTYDIGLSESDGTVISADGIDAGIALADIDAVGETVICDGALIEATAGIGSQAGQVVITATGTFTAGHASLEVEYIVLDDRANS